VGLTQLFELVFGILVFVDIGVVLTGQLAVGLFDLILGGIPADTEGMIVVLKLDGHMCSLLFYARNCCWLFRSCLPS